MTEGAGLTRTSLLATAAFLTIIASPLHPQEPARSFAMGMTYWPPSGSVTPESVLQRDLGPLLRHTEIVHVQIPWCPGVGPIQAEWMSTVARASQKDLAISIDWLADSRQRVRCGRVERWTFADSSSAASFETTMARLAHRYQPEYLLLGVEVDFYAVAAPEDFSHFLRAYRRTRDRIEQAAPRTRTGVSIQYEHALGIASGSATLVDDMVAAFEDMSDFLGLSVYPFVTGKAPEEVDLAYFEPVSELSVPLAVFETGWPGADIPQKTYVKHILKASDELKASLVLWTSLQDVEPGALRLGTPLWADEIGFRDGLGNPKPAFEVWQDWLRRPISRPGNSEIGESPQRRSGGVEGFGVEQDGASPVAPSHDQQDQQYSNHQPPAPLLCPDGSDAIAEAKHEDGYSRKNEKRLHGRKVRKPYRLHDRCRHEPGWYEKELPDRTRPLSNHPDHSHQNDQRGEKTAYVERSGEPPGDGPRRQKPRLVVEPRPCEELRPERIDGRRMQGRMVEQPEGQEARESGYGDAARRLTLQVCSILKMLVAGQRNAGLVEPPRLIGQSERDDESHARQDPPPP